jgi:hypothetical protein
LAWNEGEHYSGGPFGSAKPSKARVNECESARVRPSGVVKYRRAEVVVA